MDKTIKVSEEFHRKLKIYAVKTDKTIGTIVQEAVEEKMKEKKKK